MSRTIETVLRLKGESEYRSGLKNCASEMKVMKSELSLASSEFRTNANSMEALTKKGDILSRMYETQERKVALLRGALENAKNAQQTEQQAVADLREQYEKAKKALSDFGDSVDETNEDYRKAKAETDNLRESLAKHQIKLDAATNSISKYEIQLNHASVELNKLSDQQEENNKLLKEAQESSDGCAKSIDRYGDVTHEAAEATKGAGSACEAMANQMMASGIQEKVDDLAASMMEASKAAQEYEISVAKVSTIADSNVLSKEGASSGLLQLSTNLRKDANEVADAAYEALSAGVATANVLDFTAQSSKLAVAGFTDTATAVDVLTTIMNAYRLEADQAEQVASKLVKTQDLGKITVDEIAKVIGRVIPSAAAYSVDLNNIATAYAAMTASGVNAENSTTYLSTMLDELADSGSDVAAVLEEQTGKSFAQLMAEGKSLGDVLGVIGKSVDNDKTKFSNLWSSATAGKAAISLLNTGTEEFNKTLNEMANSSGTVNKNYEKMTDVSDYASQRLTVANKNLAIAVGNQLNPVLDEARNAGAKILEVAAKIIDDNPILVSLISGLVASIGFLSAALSGMMIAKSVAAAMTALNISLSASPLGLAAIAVGGLVTALTLFCDQAEESSERVNELTEAAQRLNESTTTGARDYADAVASAETAYVMCDGYISRLAELEAQGLKTDEQQKEYALLIDEIKTLIPELNVEIDAQTGLIKGGAAALREQTSAWKDAAIAEAAYARYKDDIAAMVDAEYELAKNKAKLKIVEDTLTSATTRQEQILTQIARTQTEYNQVCGDFNLTAEESARQSENLLGELQGLQSELREVADIEKAAKSEQDALNQAIADGESVVASNKAVIESSTEALKLLTEDYPQLTGAVTGSAEEMADSVTESTDKMDEAYLELWQNARTSLDGQVGLFEKLDGKCEQSTKDMIEALKSQKKAFNEYADNIQIAMERGIDIGLVQELSDGSQESMQILAELVTATDEEIANLNTEFLGTSEAKDNVAKSMAGIDVVVSDVLKDSQKVAYAEGKKLGSDTAQGIIDGVKSKEAAYRAAMAATAAVGPATYAKTVDQHSPSRLYRKLAANDVEGLIVQYQADTPKLKKATAQLAEEGYTSAIQARRAAVPSLVSSVNAVTASESSQSVPLLQQILSAIKAGKVIVLDSGELIGSTASGYNAAMGQDQILIDRGAK